MKRIKGILTNWRPLTLFGSFYKIVSAVPAKLLKPVLDNLLSHEQKVYIPGRFISECTRSAYDLFTHTKENNLPGMILLIDFEKAFDSISLKYIMTTLDIFNFGENFKKWIRILLGMNDHGGFQAVTVFNGNISRRINVDRGCRQDYPVSG